ncbi:N-acetyl-beta-glucosaminyl-glycoprotein 4-beta-N-acetylgalactosaminyltransferase 1, partial [Trichoplax sp. H2]
RYYKQTHDDHFTLIITDFNSTDVDIPALLKSSSLKHHYMNIKTENFQFSRTIGINRAATWIRNDDAILLMYDLHLTFPVDMLDNVRKRCKQGKAAYFPIVTRLGCGFAPRYPNGYPELWGFGISAFYKSDYANVGGMNDQKFRFKWGGEDSDIADRTISNSLEIERLLHPYFFHYYHRQLPWKKSTAKKEKENKDVNEPKIIKEIQA